MLMMKTNNISEMLTLSFKLTKAKSLLTVNMLLKNSFFCGYIDEYIDFISCLSNVKLINLRNYVLIYYSYWLCGRIINVLPYLQKKVKHFLLSTVIS